MTRGALLLDESRNAAGGVLCGLMLLVGPPPAFAAAAEDQERDGLRAEQPLPSEAQTRQEAGPAPEDEDASPVADGDQTLETFVAAAAKAAADLPEPCLILSAPNAGALIPSYPRRGRIDYGSAVITVRFAVDEAGNTVDEEVAVLPERSKADQPRHFDRFAQAVIKQVQSWSVQFPNREELSCSMAQQASITVRFDY